MGVAFDKRLEQCGYLLQGCEEGGIVGFVSCLKLENQAVLGIAVGKSGGGGVHAREVVGERFRPRDSGAGGIASERLQQR